MAQVPEEAPEVSALHSGPQGRNGDSWVGGQLTPRLYCTLLHMGSEGMFRKTKTKNEKMPKPLPWLQSEIAGALGLSQSVPVFEQLKGRHPLSSMRPHVACSWCGSHSIRKGCCGACRGHGSAEPAATSGNEHTHMVCGVAVQSGMGSQSVLCVFTSAGTLAAKRGWTHQHTHMQSKHSENYK